MTPIAESTESRKYRMRWRTLTVLSLSLLVIMIDMSIVNVSIPTIQRELGASELAAAKLKNIQKEFREVVLSHTEEEP